MQKGGFRVSKMRYKTLDHEKPPFSGNKKALDESRAFYIFVGAEGENRAKKCCNLPILADLLCFFVAPL